MQSIQKVLDHYEMMIKELRLLADSSFTRALRSHSNPDYVRLITRLNSYIYFTKQLQQIKATLQLEVKPNDTTFLENFENSIFIKSWDKFDNEILSGDLVSVCREYESIVFTGGDGQLYLTTPSGTKMPLSLYYSGDLVMLLREASKISNRPKVVVPILPSEIEPVSDFLWVNQFGKGEEKDRRGRWAIQCLYHGTLIATIARVDHINYGRFYSTKDFFPSLKSSNPCRDVYQEKEKDIQKIIAAVEERFKSFINPK